MRMSWRMNKIRIIKKLFVSLTLLVFCELLLLLLLLIDPRNTIRSASRVSIRVYIASLVSRPRRSIGSVPVFRESAVSVSPLLRGWCWTRKRVLVLDALVH